MKLQLWAICASLLAPTLLAGPVPVSRTSTYSGEGYYYSNWNYPYQPVVSYNWHATDSCNTFGAWNPSNVSSYTGHFWHYSIASVNYAQFIALAEVAGHQGNTYSMLDDQRTNFEYVFDVFRPTRVNIIGFGDVKLSSVAGFSLLASSVPSGGKDYTLPPSRYTLKDLFVSGHGQGHFQMQVRDCLGDMNNDAQVNDVDFTSFLMSYITMLCSDPTMPAGCPADLNNDSIVDDADFVIFGQSYDSLMCP